MSCHTRSLAATVVIILSTLLPILVYADVGFELESANLLLDKSQVLQRHGVEVLRAKPSFVIHKAGKWQLQADVVWLDHREYNDLEFMTDPAKEDKLGSAMMCLTLHDLYKYFKSQESAWASIISETAMLRDHGRTLTLDGKPLWKLHFTSPIEWKPQATLSIHSSKLWDFFNYRPAQDEGLFVPTFMEIVRTVEAITKPKGASNEMKALITILASYLYPTSSCTLSEKNYPKSRATVLMQHSLIILLARSKEIFSGKSREFLDLVPVVAKEVMANENAEISARNSKFQTHHQEPLIEFCNKAGVMSFWSSEDARVPTWDDYVAQLLKGKDILSDTWGDASDPIRREPFFESMGKLLVSDEVNLVKLDKDSEGKPVSVVTREAKGVRIELRALPYDSMLPTLERVIRIFNIAHSFTNGIAHQEDAPLSPLLLGSAKKCVELFMPATNTNTNTKRLPHA